jgi:hypothetical protein
MSTKEAANDDFQKVGTNPPETLNVMQVTNISINLYFVDQQCKTNDI